MNHLQTHNESASMPIPMAVDANPTTEVSVTAPVTKKDRAYFQSAMKTAVFDLYRSGKTVANLLLEARLNLSPEEYQTFIREDCKFDYSLVCKFINMAANYRLNDPTNQLLLPEAWTCRYEIMQMKETTFRIGVKEGIINSACTLADLKKLRAKLETPSRKKASPKAKAGDKKSTAPTTAEAPTPTAAPAKAEEPESSVQKAAVKAPVNNPGLRVVDNSAAAESNSAAGTATATAPALAPAAAAAPVGRIAIVVSQAIQDQHQADLDDLIEEIKAVVKEYEFIGGVELELAA